MTFDRSDFVRIQLSLAAAVVMVATGLSIGWFADKQLAIAKQTRNNASRQLQEYDGKLKRVRAEEAEIKQKSALYSELLARGIIGDEQRLDWVELIKDIREARRLLDIQYEFQPQQSLDKTPIAGYNFNSSTMRVSLKLLHEMDLVNFINDLRSKARAFIRVRSCKVVRASRNANADDFSMLTAECQIDWITIAPAKGAG